ncbi:MAG TPA: hypothetical protein VFR20_08265 [Burkholderiaceae bacterium]|nr:hypothetical protein [Burkholderiaceae bacterium]
MGATAIHIDQFVHIRIIIGILLGLSISRLVTGLSRSVQTSASFRIYPLHVVWIVYLLLAIVDFWWFEYGLLKIKVWTFGLYLFVIFYASIFVFISSILFPDRGHGYVSYEKYFQGRRRPFYCMMLLLSVLDVVDSWIKGREHFASLGVDYLVVQAIEALGALVAIIVASRKYQMAYALTAVACEVYLLSKMF